MHLLLCLLTFRNAPALATIVDSFAMQSTFCRVASSRSGSDDARGVVLVAVGNFRLLT